MSSSAAGNWRPGFWSLFTVQFQGAFSDNVFKFLVIFFVSSITTEAQRDGYVSLVLLLFALPFILFAMAGGYLADRYSKRSVVIGTKWLEVGIMGMGTIGLWLQSIPSLMGVIFLMSLQSTFFGPSKYGSMPEILPESRLSWGNGIIGLGTFLSIITGGIVAGLLSESLGNERLWWGGVGLVGLAICGVIAARGLPRLAAANPTKAFRLNFLSEVIDNVKLVRSDRVLWVAIVGAAFFWFIGALFGEPTILVYGKDVLDLGDTDIGILKAALALGIGGGSALAGVLSGRKIEYGLVPLGGVGLAIGAAGMAIPGLSYWQVALVLSWIGVAGGFFIVPLNAIAQHRPEAENKGSVIATGQWLNAVGIFFAAGCFWLLKTKLALAPGQIFLTGAVATLMATLAAVKLVPDSLFRLGLWVGTHTLYRVKVRHGERLPEKGGALVVCNHVSLADACLLMASTDRPIRFLVHDEVHRKWWVKPFSKMLRSIPISSEQRPREMVQALKAASDWIEKGHVVCLFAEGQITRTGQMLPFRRGLERIMKGVSAPIVPVHLDNVWGSIFSFEKGRFYTKWPRRVPYPVTVSYGEPMPAETTATTIRERVLELGAEAWEERRGSLATLERKWVRTARRHPWRMAMVDAKSKPVCFFTALTRSLFLAGRLLPVWRQEVKVGILLPPSVGGALVNQAALLLGRVPVNLNYTLSHEGLVSCIRQCGLTKVVTTQAFVERLKVVLPVEVVLVEQVAAVPKFAERMKALLLGLLVPARWMTKALTGVSGPGASDLATVIFSSGSTGEPKGVMLTHGNVVSNLEQMDQAISFRGEDRVLGILPFFHSFGFTGTVAAQSVLGLGVVYHFNPTDARVVGELVHRHRVSFLLATPTFLQLYVRGCRSEQFGSVRFAMVGAEKLPRRLADAFEAQFGIAPREAYGCTECSPAVAVNTSDFRAAGFHQVGSKRGSIGHPVPGMAVRIVDPETGERKGLNEAGLMLLKGPNIMEGYLGEPEKTAAVLKEGWYVTGDIAAMDEDGFITITDRLSRFSKIGGEMVPHIKVEEQLNALAGAEGQVFAVTSLPDEKKGERLIVLHTLGEAELEGVLGRFAEADLPNLWKPKRDQFVAVDALPMLGTGKIDLRGVRDRAAQAAGGGQG